MAGEGGLESLATRAKVAVERLRKLGYRLFGLKPEDSIIGDVAWLDSKMEDAEVVQVKAVVTWPKNHFSNVGRPL